MSHLKKYLITDPKYYSNDKDLFRKNLEKVLKIKKVDMACFRDKESENFETLAQIFIQTCKEFNIKKILINGNYYLAHSLGATGVHLTSTQFDEIKEALQIQKYLTKKSAEMKVELRSRKQEEYNDKIERIKLFLESSIKDAIIYIKGDKVDIAEKISSLIIFFTSLKFMILEQKLLF